MAKTLTLMSYQHLYLYPCLTRKTELTTHTGRRSSTEVVDEIPIEYADGYYIHAYNVQLNKSDTVKAESRKALTRTGMQPHVIGNTF